MTVNLKERRIQEQRERELVECEGLIGSTARQIQEVRPEMDLDDIAQRLRWKAYKAIRAYDAKKARGLPKRNYIFMAVYDERKSILRLRRHDSLHIEDFTTDPATKDAFESRYLSSNGIQDRSDMPDLVDLPELTTTETDILLRLYDGDTPRKIVRSSDWTLKQVEATIGSLQRKLSHLL